jgi:hypothetical protein
MADESVIPVRGGRGFRFQQAKGIDMKFSSAALSACSLLVLTACASAPVAAPAEATPPTFSARITQFPHPQVNEAASAYVSHFKQTVEQSLQTGRYQRDLAAKYLNAESCFDSRASRLLDKSLTPEEKAGLVQAHVAPEKLRAYQALAHGQFMRPHGLETFSCEIAGLPVDRSNVKY